MKMGATCSVFYQELEFWVGFVGNPVKTFEKMGNFFGKLFHHVDLTLRARLTQQPNSLERTHGHFPVGFASTGSGKCLSILKGF